VSKQTLWQDGLAWTKTPGGGWVATAHWSRTRSVTVEADADHGVTFRASGMRDYLEAGGYSTAWSARRGAARWLRAMGVL